MRSPCPKCGRVHPGDMARARNRYQNIPITYQANYDGAPIRATRGEAINDQCNHWWQERKTP